MKNKYDYVIAGAGIVGVTLALDIKRNWPDKSVCLIEKNSDIGSETSTHNSGVLHSGIYYDKKTIKHKVCSEGNQILTEYCKKNNLPFKNIQKIILPTSNESLDGLDKLISRARDTNLAHQVLDKNDITRLEPNISNKYDKALLIKSTSIACPISLMRSLLNDLKNLNIDIMVNTDLVGVDMKKNMLICSNKDLFYKYFINCAGAYADKIFQKFNGNHCYTILPFKGSYYKLSGLPSNYLNHLIYPVPNPELPFLGIHTVNNFQNEIFLGPSAEPSFKRAISNSQIINDSSSYFEVIKYLFSFFLKNKKFRKLSISESKKIYKYFFLNEVKKIVPTITNKNLIECDKYGIRAQLFNKKTGDIMTDFVIEEYSNSLHILNAISPAWTSSFSFSKFVINHYLCKNSI